MTKQVISTMNDAVAYTVFGDNPRRVLVRGGGRTEVSDSDAEFLSAHGMFRQHQAAGHVKIVDTARDP